MVQTLLSRYNYCKCEFFAAKSKLELTTLTKISYVDSSFYLAWDNWDSMGIKVVVEDRYFITNISISMPSLLLCLIDLINKL